MTTVASKNMFDLLGNDIVDEDETPKAPMKEIVKKSTTSKKADALPTKTAAPVDSTRGAGRRPRGEGNDAAFRDRGAGRENNRSRPTDESGAFNRGDRAPRGRGGSGRGRGRQFDRHSATDRVDTDKQVSQGWGSNKGNSEWNDEQAGQNIAQAEATDENAAAAVTTEGETQEANEEPVPETEEDKTKSFAQYRAEIESRAPVEELPEARRANEGARENKKWATAKELVKEEDEEYFIGGKSKQKNLKTRKEKEKQVVDINHSFQGGSTVRGGNRGGRGGARGDRPPRGGSGRGEYRGSRGGRGATAAAAATATTSSEAAPPKNSASASRSFFSLALFFLFFLFFLSRPLSSSLVLLVLLVVAIVALVRGALVDPACLRTRLPSPSVSYSPCFPLRPATVAPPAPPNRELPSLLHQIDYHEIPTKRQQTSTAIRTTATLPASFACRQPPPSDRRTDPSLVEYTSIRRFSSLYGSFPPLTHSD
ncbi:hypothetical protein H072_1708 [Dactylellina haptotyla CBS 200.50]|uniref:Hyaluronan/mRNA-binding protein domain-containing protein n=1 Tax=Dactylellina haptotyla (strain CBS 200.50) TaxID=1284197 RepID=S8AN65_DACHA|nr:hypothetical protein H072_1708 [Dactylellina haptotyla CBS 200.50]